MALDIEDLLKPIAAGAPCGEELRYDPAFGELSQAAQPETEYVQIDGREVARAKALDWPRVRRDSLALAKRGHDLRLQMVLLRGLVGTDGPQGARDGLKLIRAALERYWDELHPRLDTDESDPAEQAFHRLNCLRQLVDPAGLLGELRRAVLVTARGLGALSLRDLDQAAGRSPANGEARVDAQLVEAVFKAAEPEAVASTHAALEESLAELALIERLLAERLGGAEMVPDFEPLQKLLQTMRGALAPHLGGGLAEMPEPAAGTVAAPSSAPSRAAAAPGAIESREDVLRTLDQILDYYRRKEPTSPIPLLVERTRRLVPLSFLELMEDLAPSGVKQLKELGGLEKADKKGG